MNPPLSFDQLKRLRKVLVEYDFFENSIQATKFTAYRYQCKETALRFFNEHNVPSELKDISELYHYIPRRRFSKKENVVATGIPSAANSSKLTISAKKIKKSNGRGKGKKPSKIMYPVRFEELQINSLRNLGGNVSKHIRDAVEAYLLAQNTVK